MFEIERENQIKIQEIKLGRYRGRISIWFRINVSNTWVFKKDG